jgi:hypothetical protein
VTWALDDAVAAYREARGGPWRPCNWQQLEGEVRTAQTRRRQAAAGGGGAVSALSAVAGWQVKLRAPVAELRALWQRRLEVRGWLGPALLVYKRACLDLGGSPRRCGEQLRRGHSSHPAPAP